MAGWSRSMKGLRTYTGTKPRAFLAGLALHVKANYATEDQHLLTVRKLVALRRGTPRSAGAFEELLNQMLESQAVDGLIARAAAVLLQKPFKERGSVISALHRHTEFLDRWACGSRSGRCRGTS